MQTNQRMMWIAARYGTVALIVVGALVALASGGALGSDTDHWGMSDTDHWGM